MPDDTNGADEQQKLPEKLANTLDAVLDSILAACSPVDRSEELYDRLVAGEPYKGVLTWYMQEACPVPVGGTKNKEILRKVVEATLQHVIRQRPEDSFDCPCGCEKKIDVRAAIQNLRLFPFLKFFQLCN